MVIQVQTADKRQIIDITDQVEQQLKGSGLVNIFVRHTTAAVTVADLDPGTDKDYLAALEGLTPDKNWQHPHDPGHFPDHLWSALIGVSLSVPYEDSKLLLGSWQRVILIELDGPRQREIIIAA